ncbi:MAG: hypothetical protein K6C94_04975 [Candidatus Gastranaerophilales bacterium]|nr:hypothetical protein [Candidatus Gastranaerophilales bacterium]
MIIKRSQSDNTSNTQQPNNAPAAETFNNGGNTAPAANSAGQQDNLPFNFDDIVFDARQERRQGSRRRGYRRIDERNIVSRAQEEANSIREEAVKEGHRIGIEKAQEEIQALLQAIQEFYSFKDKMFEYIAPHILELSVEIAKKIINKEIEQDKTALLSLIKFALGDTLKINNRITVRVKPQDVITVRENLPDFLSADSIEAQIKVVPDETIVSGGAIIVTENGIIDATIDTGLSILEQAFKNINQG